MRKYVMLYGDMSGIVEELSEQEAGRLLKAVLKYAQTGQVVTLPGSERLVYKMLIAQFERDREAYEGKVVANRENGRKGGRPRKSAQNIVDVFGSEKPTGFSENPTKANGYFENPTKPTKTQDKDKEKEKEKDKDNYHSSGGGDPLTLSLEEIRKGRELRETIESEAARVGLPCHDAQINLAVDLAQTHGLDKLLDAIRITGNGPTIAWRYVKGVLERQGASPSAARSGYEDFGLGGT